MIYWRTWQKNRAKYWAAFDTEAPNMELARIVSYPNSHDYRVVSRARTVVVSYPNLSSAKSWAKSDLDARNQDYTRAVEAL